MMLSIDLNCDLGEGGGHDAEIMSLISSCNIACGGHYGNEFSIAMAVKTAVLNDVNIGAHPSYPDKDNFGRKHMDISLSELKKSIFDQIQRVFKEVKAQNGRLHHIKPHGALYNDLMTNVERSRLIISIVQAFDDELILFVPPNSVVEKLAKGKLKTMIEGFADRKYEEKFHLVSRKKKHAILLEKEAVLKQVLPMVKEEKITLENGKFLLAKFDTICVHGDHPKAVEILAFLNEELPKNNIQISKK